MILKEFVRVEDFVHTVGDPLWIENAERFETRVILKMQDNAEVMQEADQRALAGFIRRLCFDSQARGILLG